jgi:hypothetical protein
MTVLSRTCRRSRDQQGEQAFAITASCHASWTDSHNLGQSFWCGQNHTLRPPVSGRLTHRSQQPVPRRVLIVTEIKFGDSGPKLFLADLARAVAVEPPERLTGMRWIDTRPSYICAYSSKWSEPSPGSIDYANKGVSNPYHRVFEVPGAVALDFMISMNSSRPIRPSASASPESSSRLHHFIERIPQRLRVLGIITTW